MSTENDTEDTSTAIVATKTEIGLWEASGFGQLQRVAKLFSQSDMVPKDFKGNIPNCTIALDIALRTGQAPLAVFQSIYFVGGKPGWSTAYLIAQAKLRGLRIGWDVKHEPGHVEVVRTVNDWNGVAKGQRPKRKEKKGIVPMMAVTAYTTIEGERQEITVDTVMAVAEDWVSNEKYSSLCELMLRYRSAAMLINLYMPEIKLGLPVAEEIETIVVEQAPMKQGAEIRAALTKSRTTMAVGDIDSGVNLPRDVEDAELAEQDEAEARMSEAELDDDDDLGGI